MFKKIFLSTALATGLAFSMLSPAKAGLIDDFTDDYDVSNWTALIEGDGLIDLTGAPNSIVLTGADDGTGDGQEQNVDFTIAAVGAGLVSFNWNFTTSDVDGPSFDPFGYLRNNVFFQLTNDAGPNTQSDSVSFAVITGEVFGFRQASSDSFLGAGVTTISNFSAPSAVPEPTSLALLGLGLAGLGFLRRRRT